jgi:DNA-binding GntR family transcriptional regulator
VSLREQIAAALRGSIVSGQMEQGITYSVPTLAERFGVSATPVREAMLDLVKEGLVEPIRNKGFRIVVASDQDLDEVTQLRQLIEPPTVAYVANSICAQSVARLRAMAEEICQRAAAGDIISYLEADRVFHLEILALAGNRRLVESVNLLRAQTRLYGLSRLAAEGTLVTSAAEHLELLDAMEAHDGASAERLARRHIGHVRGLWANRTEPSDESSFFRT